jgi:D-ribose pyranose/furanose isomerase RbsD
VPIPDIIEEMDLVLIRKESGTDRVHWRISPTLVVEPALLVEEVEELGVGLAPPEVEGADLEIGPDYVA